MQNQLQLTEMSKGSGCGCKINPAVLKELLSGFTVGNEYPNLVVGNSMADDCSVYDLGDGRLLLQTVDFFTPIVNDAYTFGAAAAANALSDIWAMGGKALMTNAVFSWPIDILSIDLGREVLRGANDVCKNAGVPLAGGHSIDGKEPLFGLSVTGICNQEEMKSNAGAEENDIIILTKTLGTGMLAAAHKRGIATELQDKALFAMLQTTNSIGEQLGKLSGIHAMTDVTGFGLVGHLLEICRASNAGAIVEGRLLNLEEQAIPLAENYVLPDNALRNWNAYEKHVVLNNQSLFPWIVDPQTNGGLLCALSEASLPDVEAILQKHNVVYAIIGIFQKSDKTVMIN